jgi:hypothetical protein
MMDLLDTTPLGDLAMLVAVFASMVISDIQRKGNVGGAE